MIPAKKFHKPTIMAFNNRRSSPEEHNKYHDPCHASDWKSEGTAALG